MKSIALFSTLCIALLPSLSHAGGSITANLSNSGDVQSTGTGGSRFIKVDAGNSYCCDFTPTTNAVTLSSVSTSILGVATYTGVERSSATPSHSHGKRVCFIAPASELVVMTVGTLSTSPTPLDAQCNETSLFGGYNTNANPFNFLEISNLTNESITGKIFATNFDGTVVINGNSFTVPAGLRIDVDVHTAAGANKFGILKIIHDGPLGGIQANTSFYSGTPAALTLRGTVPAQPRNHR